MRIGVGAECKRLHAGFSHSAIMPPTQAKSFAPNSEIAESKIKLQTFQPKNNYNL